LQTAIFWKSAAKTGLSVEIFASFVKLSVFTVISRVSFVNLTPPFVVLEVPFVDLLSPFVILTGPSVNSPLPFVKPDASVRRNDDVVRGFDPSVREIFRAAGESFRRIRALDVHADRIKHRQHQKRFLFFNASWRNL
jgi:hypothetical protein